MKRLLILSGKGGTGKTTTAGAFISYSKTRTFADCDVDAPNLHIISKFENEAKLKDYMGSPKSKIDTEKCIGCGLCAEKCRFNSIERVGSKYKINEYACEGCGVCELVCPVGAAKLYPDVAGEVSVYKDHRIFATAELKMGRGTSGKLVAEVKSTLYNEMKENKLIDKEGITIIDGSPGIGCPVIASISGVDMVLVITEPTLSGMSDMKRILKIAEIFKVPTAVCINRADLSEKIAQEIIDFCKDNDIIFLGKVPYDETVSIAVNSGKSIAEYDTPANHALKEVYNKVVETLLV